MLKLNSIDLFQVVYNSSSVATYCFDGVKVSLNRFCVKKHYTYFSLHEQLMPYTLLNALKIPISKSFKFLRMVDYFRLKCAYYFKPFKQVYVL